MGLLKIVLILSLHVVGVSCDEQINVNICQTKGTTNCGDCIAISEVCGWCLQENFTDTATARCDTTDRLQQKGCDKENIFNPDHKETIVKNVPLADGHDDTSAVQLQPQHVKVKLRRNKPYKLNITYRVAENFPVDMYFLFDLSFTMFEQKNALAGLAIGIAKKVETVTTDYQFGFGSFLDKVAMPFTLVGDRGPIDACRGIRNMECELPYSFKHRMTLAKNPKKFINEVNSSKFSANHDKPEGGLDAIMQCVVCEDQIGWRNNSRRILIYSSDAPFHVAGDGKLAGIVMPNDGECYMDEHSMYSASLNQDYPSVGLLAKKVLEKSVNIIFAVPEKYDKLYQKLSERIQNSRAAVLSPNASNIVNIINTFYQTIRESVELRHTGGRDITAIFQSKCKGYVRSTTKTCDDINTGESVVFELTLQVDKCPKERFQTIEISTVGIPEKLIVDVEVDCDCPCEGDTQAEKDSPKCTAGNGTYACGVCSCNKYRYGEFCQCDGQGDHSADVDQKCIRENSTSKLPCSGRGNCVCGQCVCSDSRYEGRYCECDKLTCKHAKNSLVCGGPTQGQCVCGNCECKEGFINDDCGCATSTDSCVPGNTTEVCSGHGDCECGDCHCHGNYRGRFCNDCPTCKGMCEENQQCANCAVSDDPACDELDCKNVETVAYLEEDSVTSRTCFYQDTDGCTIRFTYEQDGKNVIVKVLDRKKCAEPVDIVPIIAGIICSILFIGLVLLVIWKILISAYDKLEYAKFEKEVNDPTWAKEDNPIYEGAVCTYQNPVCGDEF